jgi:hypothetical protein
MPAMLVHGEFTNMKTTMNSDYNLIWKREGADQVLYWGKRKFGRIIPDAKWPGMFRSTLPNGQLSDMANIAWAKTALWRSVIRELEYEAPNKAA